MAGVTWYAIIRLANGNQQRVSVHADLIGWTRGWWLRPNTGEEASSRGQTALTWCGLF